MSSLNMRYSFLYLIRSLIACFDWKSSNWTRAVGHRSLIAAMNSSGKDFGLFRFCSETLSNYIYMYQSNCSNHRPPILPPSFPGICCNNLSFLKKRVNLESGWVSLPRVEKKSLPGIVSQGLVVGSNVKHNRKNTSIRRENVFNIEKYLMYQYGEFGCVT